MDRITEVINRINQWTIKKYANPYKLDIFITNRCNLKCRFCQFPLLDKKFYKNELSRTELLGIINAAAKLDVKIIGILGGEPFVNNNIIIEVMETIKRNNIDGSLVTNGTLINVKQIKRIIKMKWNLIRFSIDGSTEKIHDSLRGKSYKKIISNLKIFQELKEGLNEDLPTIEINTVLCRKNISDLSKIIELAKRFGIINIYFLPMIEFTEDIQDLKIQEKDIPILLENIKSAKKLSEKYNITTNLEVIERYALYSKSNEMERIILEDKKSEGFIPCFLPWYGLNISADGIVTPCAAASGSDELNCGNVSQNTLGNIWNSKAFEKLRKRMLKKMLPAICSKCCVPLLDENRQIRAALYSQ